MDYLGANGFKENLKEDALPCFEWVYREEGTEYMNVYVHADSVGKGNLHTGF